MAQEKLLDHGREAYRQKLWKDAYSRLSELDREVALSPEDLELLATSAYLVGKFSQCCDIWLRAHNDYLSRGYFESAIRCAFWLGFILMNKGESARGSGWIVRARSLIDEVNIDCVESGYLMIPQALRCLSQNDYQDAYTTFDHAGRIGSRFQNRDLITLSRLGRGQSLIRMGKVDEGLDLLDEAMVAVESGEISAVISGIVYCAVIEACVEIFDLRRAAEWTAALDEWCASQPHLVPYRGQCLTRRSEILKLHGEWPDAMIEAQRAVDLLTEDGEPAAGAAFYQLGELLRIQGNFAEAEDAYVQSHRWGRNPQPGLSLLRLAQGQVDVAMVSIQQTVKESKIEPDKSMALSAYVEIMLTANEIGKARSGLNELTEIANGLDAPLLRAIAAQAEGAVLLAEGNTQSALEQLRFAWTIWLRIKAPYEAAKTRILLGTAYHRIGDKDTAKMEYKAARWTLDLLNALPDIARVDSFLSQRKNNNKDGLTPRELQVLLLMANGKSNKIIGKELFISERTVERHISNIFTKLDVSSRTEATSYAYKQGLI